MKKITLLFIITFISFSSLQTRAFSKEEPMKKLLMQYIEKMNALNNGTKKGDVLELFDEKYKGNTVYVNLSGTLVRKNYSKKDISVQLSDIVNDINYKFKLILDKVVFVTEKERSGTISAVINFESYIDQKIAEKGTMLMDLVAIQSNGGWKIVQNNMIRISEAKDIGECVCYIYEKGSTKFVTEVYFPSGLEYSQDLNAFQVTSKESKRIIKSDNNDFYWSRDTGKLTFKGASIGKATNARKAVEYVLKNLYKDSCVNIVFN